MRQETGSAPGAGGMRMMTAEAMSIQQVAGSEDARGPAFRPPLWRAITGGVLMAVGALVLAFFLALAVTVTLTFVDWRAPLDGLGTVLMVCVPPMLGGAGLLALGRWAFGGWSSSAPIAQVASYALPIAGVVAAFSAIIMFFLALYDETGRGGAWAVSQFLLCIVFSLALIAAGMVFRRRVAT